MSLLIVIPVSQSDVHLLDPFVAVLEHFGGLEKNNVLVVAGNDVTEEAVMAAERLRRIAKSATLFTIPAPQGGWPRACNEHFMRTVQRLRDTGNTEPFLWLETDAPPIKPNWAGALQGAYNEAGLPYMGRKVLTMDCCPNPGHASAKVLFDGYHMNGVGVYPADFHARSQLYKMANRERVPQPWDIYCRWEIAPSCHDCGLIIGLQRATKFEAIEGGYRFVSDDGSTREVIVGDEVLLHSCKDGSLAGILTGRRFETPLKEENETETERVETRAPCFNKSAGPDDAQGEPALANQSSNAHETKAPADCLSPPAQPSGQPSAGGLAPLGSLLTKVLEVLPEVGSKERLGKLSSKLFTKKAEVKEALEKSGKFTIRGPAEWVERIAA